MSNAPDTRKIENTISFSLMTLGPQVGSQALVNIIATFIVNNRNQISDPTFDTDQDINRIKSILFDSVDELIAAITPELKEQLIKEDQKLCAERSTTH